MTYDPTKKRKPRPRLSDTLEVATQRIAELEAEKFILENENTAARQIAKDQRKRIEELEAELKRAYTDIEELRREADEKIFESVLSTQSSSG